MKDDKLVKRLVYSIISFQLFLTAIAFIIQLFRIYFGRKNEIPIFTRQLTGDYIFEILAIIIITLLVIIAGGILSFIYKLDDNKPTKMASLARLKLLLSIIPDEKKESDEYKELISLRNKRYYAYFIATGITLVCVLFCFLYMFNTKHFISNGDALKQCKKLFIYLTPFGVIAFAAFIGAKFYEDYNAKKSIEVAKRIINARLCTKKEMKNNKALIIAQASIVSVALIMILVGAITGGASDVFIKAAKICSECIGLG